MVREREVLDEIVCCWAEEGKMRCSNWLVVFENMERGTVDVEVVVVDLEVPDGPAIWDDDIRDFIELRLERCDDDPELGVTVLSCNWMSIIWSPRRMLRFNGVLPLRKSFTWLSLRDSRACITVFSGRCA